MEKEKALEIVNKQLRKAEISFHSQFNRPNAKEKEKENLANNVEFFMLVKDLINEHM